MIWKNEVLIIDAPNRQTVLLYIYIYFETMKHLAKLYVSIIQTTKQNLNLSISPISDNWLNLPGCFLLISSYIIWTY